VLRLLRIEYPDANYQLMSGENQGDRHKLALAARLRREATLTIAQIAERLPMGAGRTSPRNFTPGGTPTNENKWTKLWSDPFFYLAGTMLITNGLEITQKWVCFPSGQSTCRLPMTE
jgi:hypothetical protein